MAEVSSITSYGSYYYPNYSPYACYPEEELVSADSNVSINSDQPALEDREPPPSVVEGALAGALAGTSLACGAKTGLWVEDMWVEDPVDGGSDTGADAPQDVSGDAFDYYETSETSDDRVDADGDSMPDEVPPSDVHEVGDESIADASEDAFDYYDISETEETCERTCEPGPCSSILNVPDDYPTVEEAMRAAGRGDIIQLASGTYNIEEPLVMKECTHLYGEEGYTLTSTVESVNPSDPCTTIIGAEGSSIRSVVIDPRYLMTGPCSTILIDNVSMSLDSILVGQVGVSGEATPNIVRLYAWFAGYHDNASGEITTFNQIHSMLLNGTSHPRIRDTWFYPASSELPMEDKDGIQILENAYPDLGTVADPGGNVFLNDSLHPAHGVGCSVIPYAHSISNQTYGDISAVGNEFEQEHEIASCGTYYGTYQDMLAHPDPYDPASDILTIEDNHDNPAYGIVDYSGFVAGPTP